MMTSQDMNLTFAATVAVSLMIALPACAPDYTGPREGPEDELRDGDDDETQVHSDDEGADSGSPSLYIHEIALAGDYDRQDGFTYQMNFEGGCNDSVGVAALDASVTLQLGVFPARPTWRIDLWNLEVNHIDRSPGLSSDALLKPHLTRVEVYDPETGGVAYSRSAEVNEGQSFVFPDVPPFWITHSEDVFVTLRWHAGYDGVSTSCQFNTHFWLHRPEQLIEQLVVKGGEVWSRYAGFDRFSTVAAGPDWSHPTAWRQRGGYPAGITAFQGISYVGANGDDIVWERAFSGTTLRERYRNTTDNDIGAWSIVSQGDAFPGEGDVVAMNAAVVDHGTRIIESYARGKDIYVRSYPFSDKGDPPAYQLHSTSDEHLDGSGVPILFNAVVIDFGGDPVRMNEKDTYGVYYNGWWKEDSDGAQSGYTRDYPVTSDGAPDWGNPWPLETVTLETLDNLFEDLPSGKLQAGTYQVYERRD